MFRDAEKGTQGLITVATGCRSLQECVSKHHGGLDCTLPGHVSGDILAPGDSGSNSPTLKGEPEAVCGPHLHCHHEVWSELPHRHV